MGLKVSTIARLPIDSQRDYYVYFLDYGWSDELSQAMYSNFDNFAAAIAGHRAVVISGLNRTEFANEVLSWHQVNGEDAKNILPAILISDIHPQEFAKPNGSTIFPPAQEHLILLPLSQACRTSSDVSRVLQQILDDIKAGTRLTDWAVKATLSQGRKRPIDMLILQPNFAGVGLDLKAVASMFARKHRQK